MGWQREQTEARPVGRHKVLARNGEDRMKAVPEERTSLTYICEIKCMGLGS